MTRSHKTNRSQPAQAIIQLEAKSGRSGTFGNLLVVAVMALSVLISIAPTLAQTYETTGDGRKVLSRVDPEYPDALKRLYIGGIVRVEVVISPNGTVKATKLLGGNPILGQSTMKAVQRWKYAPSATEETLTVKVEFDPHR